MITMKKAKVLTGEQLVAKGVTKVDASLPEVGMKDVLPNNSWLEKKQIQAALEARKHLVEVERIEKRGTLSHASWCDDLELAEVTQQAGGYWQYLGHNVGKKLFLRPEEALFLMETNCLLLKHNEVIVSLQKAYSLLLGKPIGINQYKVYASLSRMGYKVFRHKKIVLQERTNTKNEEEGSLDQNEEVNKSNNLTDNSSTEHKEEIDYSLNLSEVQNVSNPIHSCEKDKTENSNKCIETNNLKDDCIISKDARDCDSVNNSTEGTFDIYNKPQKNKNNRADFIESENRDINVNMDICDDVNITEAINNVDNISCSKNESATNLNDNLSPIILKLQTLKKRLIKPCSTESLNKNFGCIPDLFMKTTVTVNVPDEQYIPRNVFVNNTNYVLNLNLIKSKPTRCSSNETTYSNVDEVNEPHVRRIRSTSHSETLGNNYNVNQNTTIPRQQHFMQYRPYNFWRPQQNNTPLNLFSPRVFPNNFFSSPQFSIPNPPLNIFLPRIYPNHFFCSPQFSFAQNPFPPRPIFSPFYSNFIQSRLNIPRAHNNTSNAKSIYLHTIKCLALKTKNLGPSARMNLRNIQGLRKLIDIYNATYNCRIRLTKSCDIIDDANIVETIELDDDDEPKSKKPRQNLKFEENLRGIKDLVSKLKMSEMNNGYKSKYRRVLSNIIKKFNKSYNADIYLNKDCEIINRKQVVLESSSDSDCMITEIVNHSKRKKLRNPFCIMKRHAGLVNATPNENVSKDDLEQSTSKICTLGEIKNNFDKNWLPSEDDFGRPEVVPKSMTSRLVNTFQEEYLYDFIRDSTVYNTWLEIKIAYLKYLEETNKVFQDQQKLLNECNFTSTHTDLQPLLRPEDCLDMGKVLERLRIISVNNNTTSITTEKSKYQVDFDVYNRDVKKFRKSNPPKPHFRIVCVNLSGSFPTALDLAALNSEYKDDIPIIFAVVGLGSISYVQMNCIDLPNYVKSDVI